MPNLEQCVWNVTALDGGVPTLTFVDAELPRTHDFVYVGYPDGVDMDWFLEATGQNIPISVTAVRPSFEITYQTYELYTVFFRRVFLTVSWTRLSLNSSTYDDYTPNEHLAHNIPH